MNESMLNSLMQLFAIIASINKEAVHILARNFVESYLSRQFSKRLAGQYLLVFDEYFKALEFAGGKKKGKTISSLSVKILGICTSINKELHIRDRFQILLSLIQFTKYFEDFSTGSSGFSNAVSDAVKTVSDGLMIRPEEYTSCHVFIADKFYKMPDNGNLLVISDDDGFMFSEIRHLRKPGLSGQLFMLRILRADAYLVKYIGKERLELNGKYLFPRHVYIMPKGSSIRSEGMDTIYFSDVVSGFMKVREGEQIDFLARDIEFCFKNSPHGIHGFSFHGKSGQLVGIMGGSGTGKSTLLKALNGSLTLDGGNIYINGHDLVQNKRKLDGIIGFIPQDDLLIEELTVYQNLHFNARLCLNELNSLELDQKVERTLRDLGLFEVSHLKVGSPLNKYISGGQRKRLNIALELIREPYILFVDEPTSGLSSTDSEAVMLLLKEQAMKGKLVLVNIHQPSSALFKMFDHLLVLDQGGYPVYSGNPVESIVYFKKLVNRVDSNESECETCGNINPEEILQIIESRDIDELGEFTPHRKKSPEEWFELYVEKIQSKRDFPTQEKDIPESLFKIPGKFRQFLIFFKRNLLSKIADRQFLSISILVAPLLAVILGFFTKYLSGEPEDPLAYVYSQNENLPAYLFMSIIVAMFIGLIISAEEIIRDRKILARESFLHLSRTAYLLSKAGFLFLLSALQMFLFVWIGNTILEIRGMTFSYWLILFSTACFANMLGLNISDGLKSVVAIYIVVPFLLVPQILLAGVIVKFDKLHNAFANHEYVPIAGDIMASRWAYEALAVNQYMNNRYQRHFYEIEMRESNISYDMQFLAPTLIQKIEDLKVLRDEDPDHPRIQVLGKMITGASASITLTRPFPMSGLVDEEGINDQVADSAINWLRNYRSRLSVSRNNLSVEKDKLIDDMTDLYGSNAGFITLKKQYYNEKLADMVLNRAELRKIVEEEGMLIRKMEPVYQYPSSRMGRAQFFASVKRLGNLYVQTLWFNIGVLWMMTILFYLTIQFSLLRKVLEWSTDLRFLRQKDAGKLD